MGYLSSSLLLRSDATHFLWRFFFFGPLCLQCWAQVPSSFPLPFTCLISFRFFTTLTNEPKDHFLYAVLSIYALIEATKQKKEPQTSFSQWLHDIGIWTRLVHGFICVWRQYWICYSCSPHINPSLFPSVLEMHSENERYEQEGREKSMNTPWWRSLDRQGLLLSTRFQCRRYDVLLWKEHSLSLTLACWCNGTVMSTWRVCFQKSMTSIGLVIRNGSLVERVSMTFAFI